jgi:hypothetical protein
MMTLVLMLAATFAVIYGFAALYFYYGFKKKLSL